MRSGILRVHPDLAGRLADEGRLTIESQREQAKAGLGQMTDEERARLKELNKRSTDLLNDYMELPFKTDLSNQVSRKIWVSICHLRQGKQKGCNFERN